ncbi:MAG TPA: hypothetical protein VHE37_14130, partial [Nevskiaceae bacterium]|nr:hypothetical protein [Nevskiaceae bacterium]
SYVVGIPALTGAASGDLLRVNGLVSPFGGQNSVDFSAISVVQQANIPARMLMSWTAPGSAAAMATSSGTSVVFDLADPKLGAYHDVYRDDADTDLTTAGTNPTVSPASGNGFTGCALLNVSTGALSLYSTFAGFDSALNTAISGGAKLRVFAARGSFNDATATETATSCGAIVETPSAS